MSDLWPSLYTRISHDLSGLAGSVFNGTELLMDDSSADVVMMLQSATGHLVARLQFFRQTFGLQNRLDKDTTAAYLNTLNVPVQLEGTCESSLERVVCMVLADSLPKGGVIRRQGDTLTAEGATVKTDFVSLLQTGKGEISAQNAAALYAYELANQQQVRLVVQATSSSISVSLKS